MTDPGEPRRGNSPTVVILGRQGSGKGTQSALIVDVFGLVHVSTGDMLRAAVTGETELGRRAGELMERGELVPDDVMCGIVADRLARDDIVTNGVLLDGFPRTAPQADELESITAGTGGIDIALNLEVPVAEVTRRMLERGRSDDSREAIQRRLHLYEEQTSPLIEWFSERDLLTVVDGMGTTDEVFARIRSVLEDVLD
ncbi:MAG: adenylate kinase [Acidimicrobiales bacterium]